MAPSPNFAYTPLAEGTIWWESAAGELWGPYVPGDPALGGNFAGSPDPSLAVNPPVEEPWKRRNLQFVDGTWFWGAGADITSVANALGSATSDITETEDGYAAKILVDEASVYFMQMSEDTSKPVSLRRHRRSGGSESTTLSRDEVQAMAQDDDFVYFAWRNGIYRVEK